VCGVEGEKVVSEDDLKIADGGVCDKGGESVGGWFGSGSRLVEAFKEVLLADWCSQTITRRHATPNTEARDSIDRSVKAQVPPTSNSCRTYACVVALATPTSPANRSSETCRNAGLPATPTPTRLPFRREASSYSTLSTFTLTTTRPSFFASLGTSPFA